MFDTRNMATLGLYPGLTTLRSIANMGHFEVEIIIEPEVPSFTGGGASGPWTVPQTKYLLKIRVSRKGKTWEYNSKLNQSTAKVLAKFLGRELPVVNVTDSRLIKTEQPNIEVSHVSTTKIG
jgi:hypothetical protein